MLPVFRPCVRAVRTHMGECMAKSGPFARAVNVFHDGDVGLSLVDSPVTPLPRQRTTALPPASGAGPAVIPPHVGSPAAHRA